MIKIPFGWMPGHWGLKGSTRDRARAEYELTGYELERALYIIDNPYKSQEEINRYLLDLELKYEKITKEEYNQRLVDFIKDEKQANLARLELEYRTGSISETEYSKRTATIKGEPWVTVLNMNFGGKNSLEGSFELDWNDQFVERLRSEGYQGPTNESIVNQWFMEICKNIALEEFDGTGNFAPDAEANLEAVKRWSQDANSGDRKSYR